ncbi:MAG TPA: ABC transporter substrate-binding protein [Actinopolymorphaceae bacterium]
MAESNQVRPVRNTVSRREMFAAAGLGLATFSLAGCDLLSTEPAGPSGKGSAGTGKNRPKGKEAPELAARVKKGSLPPVGERLPEKPMVVEPLEEPGRYGGQLELLGFNETVDVNTTIGYENLVRWKPGIDTDLTTDQVIPNVAESFDVAEDGAAVTFRLRPGMKWSDGKPFTADDILFWYEAVATNRELTPVPIDWLTPGGKPFEVEKTDAHTVVFRFGEPNGLFLVNLATQRGTDITGFPAHYMKQFHPDHVDDIEKVVADSNSKTWIDLFRAKASRGENPERPVLDAWKLTTAIADSQRPVAERNPFYWKVDSDGSQLPYIDKVAFTRIPDKEAALLEATNGDFHLVDTGINQLRNKPVFARARDKAGLAFFETIPQQMNQMIVMLNLTHKDKALRDIFTKKDFRIGLSHAINREEIIKAVFQRQGEPWQAAPRPESPYYSEKLAKQYTEFDTALANRYLDKVLPDKDSKGMRLRPDGEKLFFQVDVSTGHPDLIDALEMVRTHWRAVGVDMSVKSEEQSLYFERVEGNTHDACVWIGGGGLGATMDPFYYMPYNFNTRYAMPWSYWYLDPKDTRAEEPPAETKKQIELYRRLLTTADSAEQDALMREILEIAADQFYCMGIALRTREYGVVHERLRNTPKVSITGWLHANLMPANPQQFYLADG